MSLALNVEARVDVSARIWGKYIDDVQKSISDRWKPNGFIDTLYAVAVFQINPDGSLKNIEMIKKSNNRDFDTYALETVKLAAPFGPLPSGSQPIKVQYYFDYQFKTEDFVMDTSANAKI